MPGLEVAFGLGALGPAVGLVAAGEGSLADSRRASPGAVRRQPKGKGDHAAMHSCRYPSRIPDHHRSRTPSMKVFRSTERSRVGSTLSNLGRPLLILARSGGRGLKGCHEVGDEETF